MNNTITKELTQIVESTVQKLVKIEGKKARLKQNPTKWSIQEILGHLIDSASNNHQRFVRAQETEVLVFPKYEQDHWVRVQGYNEYSWLDLVNLWRFYNLHLIHVIARIPGNKLKIECRIGKYESVSLEYLITDYVSHMKHHLNQIDEKSAV